MQSQLIIRENIAQATTSVAYGGQVGTNHDSSTEEATRAEIGRLLLEALPSNTDLTPLRGFKMGISANTKMHKLFFSIKCTCGTAGVLSIEVAQTKTTEEITAALPLLAERLEAQAQAFRSMPCEIHTQMRQGRSIPDFQANN